MRKPRSRRAVKKPRSLPEGDFNFGFVLTGTGWAVAQVRVRDEVHAINVSYLNDAFGAMLRATLDLLENGPVMSSIGEDGTERDIPNYSTCVFRDEPGVWDWKLTYVNRTTLHVQLKTFDCDDSTPRQIAAAAPVLDVDSSSAQWCEVLIAVAEAMLKRHGFEGYRASNFEYEFPIGLYLRLLSHRRRGFKLGWNRQIAIPVAKTRLVDELAILKKLAKKRR